MLKKICWGFLLLFVVGLVGSQVQKSMPGYVPPAPPVEVPVASSVAEMAVRMVLRDPDSAKFGRTNSYADRKLNGVPVKVACGSVNAKNGFGGYTGNKNFVYVVSPPLISIDNDTDNAQFVKLWNTLCAGAR